MTIMTIQASLRAGAFTRARGLCEEALKTERAPLVRADLFHLRAVSRQACGDLEGAVEDALQAVSAAPSLAKAWNTLAILQHRSGRTLPAIEAAETAIGIDPRMAEAHLTLASLYRSRRRPRRAADGYARALQLEPDNPVALSGLAAALTEAGDANGAIAAYERLTRVAPEDPATVRSLAATLIYAGRVAEGAAEADRALLLAPEDPTALKIRLEHGPLGGADAAVTAAKRLIRDPGCPWLVRSGLLVALARRAERRGRPEAAFRLWERKNEIAAAARPYLKEGAEAYLNGVREAWTPDLVRRLGRMSDRSERPVLVLGMPRSGTTLVEQILGGHPEVSPGGELYDLGDLTDNFMPGRSLAKVTSLPDTRLPGLVRQMGSIYADALAQYGTPDRVVIDKMPDNFKLVGLAAALMPNLKVVHMRRDPRDVCFSIWKIQFENEGHAYGNRFEDLAHYYRVHEALIAHWKRVFPGLIHTVSYEALVADPEGEGRRLVEHCGLSWSPDLLDFSGSDRAVRTASATQVREGLNTRGVGRWRPYEHRLTPMMEALRKEGLLLENDA